MSSCLKYLHINYLILCLCLPCQCVYCSCMYVYIDIHMHSIAHAQLWLPHLYIVSSTSCGGVGAFLCSNDETMFNVVTVVNLPPPLHSVTNFYSFSTSVDSITEKCLSASFKLDRFLSLVRLQFTEYFFR